MTYVELDGSHSTDVQGITKYHWQLDDESPGYGVSNNMRISIIYAEKSKHNPTHRNIANNFQYIEITALRTPLCVHLIN